jgi:glycosyltransferase involved in cell wall biosynthesis
MRARRRIAVVTPEPLATGLAGPAIRAWHLAETLGAEFDVELGTTGACERFSSRFRARHVGERELRELERWCDVLVFQGGFLHDHPFLRQSGKVLVADVYDPFHLENFEQTRGWDPAERDRTVGRLTEVLNQQLRRGDFFLCASDRQRDFWLGSLAALGRVNPANYDADPTLRALIDVVPFGLPAGPPHKSHPAIRGVVPGIGWDDKVILWAGGVYNWLDPLTLVRAVDRLRHRLPEVRLFFLGLQHPNPNIPEMRVATELRRLAGDLGLVGINVFFNEGWVDYESRADYLLEADVGVSTHLDHVETAYSFRSRILDYLWAGLPVVATGGDSFADLIEAEGMGAAVPPGDEAALEAALEGVLGDDGRAKECRENVARVAPRFAWDVAVEPLTAFCRDPRRAPDLARGRAVGPPPRSRAGWVSAAPRMVAATYRDGGASLVVRRTAGKVRRVLRAP